MTHLLRGLTLSVSTLALLAGAAGVTAQGQARPQPTPSQSAPALRPIPNSPLAVSAASVYAIADGREELIVRPADLSRPWQMLDVDGEFESLSGLTISGSTLFVTDSRDESVSTIDLGTRRRTELFKGRPLEDPTNIAVARDVFVSDSGTGKLFRFRGRKPLEVALGAALPPGLPLSLTAAGDDLYVTSADGRILEFRGIGAADPSAPQKAPTELGRRSPVEASTRSTFQKLLFRTIQQPSRMAVWNGIVYVVDNPSQSVYAFNRQDLRQVRLTRRAGWHVGGPTSVAVNDTSLYVMFGTTLERWPRIVPAVVHLRLDRVSEAMTAIYGYLQRRDMLALRPVSLKDNVETTFQEHGILLGSFPETLEPLVCNWNSTLCHPGQKTLKPLAQGQRLLVPDLMSESYIDAVQVTLTGRQTLGQVADQRVPSPELRQWTTETRLSQLNGPELERAGATTAREVTTGDFLAPTEYVRYVIPVLPRDVAPGGELKLLEKTYEGLKILSLEDRPLVSSSAAGETGQPAPLTLTVLKDEFAQLLKSIDYVEPNWLSSAFVGIADLVPIDSSHPDLMGAFLTANGIAAAGPGMTSPAPYEIRSYSDGDHSTMVAGLIGARKSGFEHPGLAPKAVLLSIDGSNSAVSEAIGLAFLRGVRIFNISAHYQPNVVPDGLHDAMNRYRLALFVVATGNNGKEACRQVLVYPACWGALNNVIVVTATTAAGGALLPTANWSRKVAHLAAPGEGFHAPGVGRSYVPATGTSFATPLVTAAAAMLYAQRFTDPWVIKQRLIATADPMPVERNRLFAGRLNIRRALGHLDRSGILSRPTGAPLEQEITVDPDDWITVQRAPGVTFPIYVRNLLRFHREPNGDLYFTYLDDQGELQSLVGATFPNVPATKKPQPTEFRAIPARGPSDVFDLAEWDDYVAPVQLPQAWDNDR